MDLNLLRVFDAVMAERNLTRAAKNLAMTQSAVSNSLRRLRVVVGDDLLVRAGYGVDPTAQALAIWPVVREALESLQAVLAPTSFDPAKAECSFVLAMADATATLLIPPPDPHDRSACTRCFTACPAAHYTRPPGYARVQ